MTNEEQPPDQAPQEGAEEVATGPYNPGAAALAKNLAEDAEQAATWDGEPDAEPAPEPTPVPTEESTA